MSEIKNIQRNTVVVTFDDDTTYKCPGCASGIESNNLREDLKFISYVLPSRIHDEGKEFRQVKTIEIKIYYDHALDNHDHEK